MSRRSRTDGEHTGVPAQDHKSFPSARMGPARRWGTAHAHPAQERAEGSEAGCPEAEAPGTKRQSSVPAGVLRVSVPGSSPRMETSGAELPAPSPGAEPLPDTARAATFGRPPTRGSQGPELRTDPEGLQLLERGGGERSSPAGQEGGVPVQRAGDGRHRLSFRTSHGCKSRLPP